VANRAIASNLRQAFHGSNNQASHWPLVTAGATQGLVSPEKRLPKLCNLVIVGCAMGRAIFRFAKSARGADADALEIYKLSADQVG
jgi:hypothetical protein